jgi:hypothetical protein
VKVRKDKIHQGTNKIHRDQFFLTIIQMDSHILLYIFHLAVVAPLFLYVGLQRDAVPDFVFTILGVMAASIALYHGYSAYKKLSAGKSAWVNWIHLGLVVPLLVYISYSKKETPRRFFELLILLGFAAAGYHGLYLFRSD